MNRIELQEGRPISSRNVTELVLRLALRRAGDCTGTLAIAEVGAGNGVFAQALRRRLDDSGVAYSYDCFDIEPEQINRRALGFTCHYMDAQRPFALERKYDLIISIELIEHLENPFHLMREIAGIARPDATVILTTPNVLSLRSRWRHFLSGCDDYFRRPYNEHWLNMGHVNPINPIQLNYMARKNGFRVVGVHTNRYTAGALLLAPFVPLMYAYSFVHYLLRERGPAQRARNRALLSLLFRPTMLFGKIAVFEMRKEQAGAAAPESWHRSDDRFAA